MKRIHVLAEVEQALAAGAPVVALESTIITHGMPAPDNVETARAVERAIRNQGAIPATIAILDGVIHVGLTASEMENLGRLPREKVVKCSRRDLARVLAGGQNGSTTVAATMLIARLVGIRVFVTGGIGGVHRGASESWDVSADLTELGRTNVAVVCAGVKSILDIPKTLEYLETQGVPVLTVGAKEFPAFFTRHSGCTSPAVVRSAEDGARILRAQDDLLLQSGQVFAVPIPEDAEADGAAVATAIRQALRDARESGATGAAETPFVLSRVAELTGGASLRANIALIKNNARFGADLAVHYSMEDRPEAPLSRSSRGEVLCIGGLLSDVTAKMGPGSSLTGASTSHPGGVSRSAGGVAANIARGVAHLGGAAVLVAAVGDDDTGRALTRSLSASGVDCRGILRQRGTRTPSYVAIHDAQGLLVAGVADTGGVPGVSGRVAALDARAATLAAFSPRRKYRVIVVDGNVQTDVLQSLYAASREQQPRCCLVFEPTSHAKATRVLSKDGRLLCDVLTPNIGEAEVLVRALSGRVVSPSREINASPSRHGAEDGSKRSAAARAAVLARALVRAGAAVCVVTAGELGSIVSIHLPSGAIRTERVAAVPCRVRSESGAGDALCAAVSLEIARAPHVIPFLSGSVAGRTGNKTNGTLREGTGSSHSSQGPPSADKAADEMVAKAVIFAVQEGARAASRALASETAEIGPPARL